MPDVKSLRDYAAGGGLEIAKSIISKKMVVIAFAFSSLLITGGYLWKSGLAKQAVSGIAVAYEEQERRVQTQQNAAALKARIEAEKLIKTEALRNLPVDNRPLLMFRGQQKTLTLDLKTDCWSRKIEVPSGERLKFWIDVSPANGHYIWFEEDREPVEVGIVGANFGQKRGVFWLLGKAEGQTAKIEIESMPKTLKDVKSPW